MKKIIYTNDTIETDIPEIVNLVFCETSYRTELSNIFAASSRDITKDMVRVKSSNVWSIKYNAQDNRIGDVYVQFKGVNGQPDDIYVYYDVPNRIYRQIVSAPSKGHSVWQLLRNKFKYAKLTGDKRTHLPNGINYTPTVRRRRSK